MGQTDQQEHLVTRQFEEQLELYTYGPATRVSQALPFLVEWVRSHEDALQGRGPLKVCEFGGGGGVLLEEIHKALGERVSLYNAELVEQYRSLQILPTIHFVRTSILDSGFDRGCFDVAIARHVLHHLVGKSLRQTRLNQRRAVLELFRVVRPGGLVLIEELVAQPPLACKTIYYLSRTSSQLGIRCDHFQITPYTVIALLTRKQLIALCEKFVPSTQWIANAYAHRKLPLRWKVTLLMNNTGNAFIAMRRPPGNPSRGGGC